VEPISHFFYSDRLKLQFWDYGQDGKPSLVPDAAGAIKFISQ